MNAYVPLPKSNRTSRAGDRSSDSFALKRAIPGSKLPQGPTSPSPLEKTIARMENHLGDDDLTLGSSAGPRTRDRRGSFQLPERPQPTKMLDATLLQRALDAALDRALDADTDGVKSSPGPLLAHLQAGDRPPSPASARGQLSTRRQTAIADALQAESLVGGEVRRSSDIDLPATLGPSPPLKAMAWEGAPLGGVSTIC